MSKRRAIAIWIALVLTTTIPIALAANSPQLAWREPIYIAAGFAGIIALALLLFQPLLAGGYLPGLSAQYPRRLAHRLLGGLLVGAVILHVAGLWITSPPDVIDALLFSSPTQFSIWGVIAMWTVFAAALLAAIRRRIRIRWKVWRFVHTFLATVTVGGTVAHAWLIEGTMETVSKVGLSALVIAATLWVMFDLKVWVVKTSNRQTTPR